MTFLRKHYRWLLLLGLLAVLYVSPLRQYLSRDGLMELLERLQNAPNAALWYMGIYVLGVVCFLPATAMMVAAGPLFGFWEGLLYAVLAGNAGCQLTYWLSRFLGKEAVEKLAGRSAFWEKAMTSLQKRGIWFLLFVRLVPVFPFSVVNYVSGLTGVRWRDYTIGTCLGMLPGAVVCVYGTTAVMDFGHNPWGLLWAALGASAFAGVIWWLWQREKRSAQQ